MRVASFSGLSKGGSRSYAPAALIPPTQRALWIIGLGGVAAAVGTVAIVLTGEGAEQPLVTALLLDWITLPYILGGLVAWWARPDSRLGPLMIGAGYATFVSSLAVSDIRVLFTVGQLLNFLPPVLFLHVFLAYPTGRLQGRFERMLVGVAYFVALGLALVGMLLGGFGPENLLAIASEPGVADDILSFQLVALSAFSLAGIGVLAVRTRRANHPHRRSLTLLIESFALGLVMIAVLFLSHYFQGPAIEPIRWTTFAIIGLAPFVFAFGLLEAAGRRNRALLAGIPDSMFRVNREGTLLDVHAHEVVTGRPEIVGSSIREYVSSEVSTQVLAAVEQALATGEVRSIEYRLAPPGQDPRYHESRIVASGDDEVIMVVRDITERKQQEDELRQSRARIIEAADTERLRLERNLHDGAQQRLVTLSLALRMVEARIQSDPKEAARLLESATDELALALEELRELARGLHPAILSDRGLGAAVEALASRAPFPVEIEAPPERLPQRVEVAAFYVISEALTNVAKYASATSASVSVSRTNGVLNVEVADDGVGGADPANGSGLRGLADRVEALAGHVGLESEPGKGTRVRAEIPC